MKYVKKYYRKHANPQLGFSRIYPRPNETILRPGITFANLSAPRLDRATKGTTMSDTITITGRLGADPDTRTIPSGATVTNLRVASTHRTLDRASGQWRDNYTNWYTVAAWDGLASAAQRLRKGDPIIVTGALKVVEWEGASGRGTKLEVKAEALGYDLRLGRRRLGEVEPTNAHPEPSVADDAEAWGTPLAQTELEPTPF